MLFLVSKNWLQSDWCEKELILAHKLNKTMSAVIIDLDIAFDGLPKKLKAYWQAVDLESGRDSEMVSALSQLRGTGKRQQGWGRLRPMPLAFMTCTAMRGSGWRTVGTTIMSGRQRMVLPAAVATALTLCASMTFAIPLLRWLPLAVCRCRSSPSL